MRNKLRTGRREKHGMAGTPTYISYQEMLKRCYDETVIRYPSYGGLGIGVCDRWRVGFTAFLEDMGEKPSRRYSLDRIDVNADYSPENCRWATIEEQADNKRNTRYITFNGVTKTLMQWSRDLGIPARIIRQRIDRDGLSSDQALSPMREPGSGRYRQRLYK